MKLKNSLILIFIIIVASILRMYNLFNIPFTHDEFSAIFRTYFNNFSELINKGVKVDTHPALVQVFLYYYTKVFGYNQWVVKMPFIVMGILSVWVFYKIALKWYNVTVALICASFLASIQYSIMYSQIARPYISGLFLSLLMVNFWSNIIINPQKKFSLNSVLFVVFASLCTYNHHFSMLFALIVGISGLFIINRQYLVKYIISGFAIIVLYLPHVNIILAQLKMGGVEEWLSKPHNDFLINYIKFIFNGSPIIYVLVTILAIWGIWQIKRTNISFKFQIVWLCWFMLPFLIGFFYSIHVSSVLQYSVLIFSFPYLFFILFGHIPEQKPSVNLLIVTVILLLNFYAVTFTRNHYYLFYHSPFQHVLLDFHESKNRYKNINAIIISHPKISNYYIKKHNYNTCFAGVDSISSEIKLIEYLQNNISKSKYLYLGGMSSINPNFIPIIQQYYPYIEQQNNYVGATTYLFSNKALISNNTSIVEINNFDSVASNLWSAIDSLRVTDSVYFSGNKCYNLTSNIEWGPTFSKPLSDITNNNYNFIDISVKVYMPNVIPEGILVASLESNNKSIYYSGISFDKYYLPSKSNWKTIYLSLKLSDIYLKHKNIHLKTFIWNKGKSNLHFDDFKIELRKGNPVVYGINVNI